MLDNKFICRKSSSIEDKFLPSSATKVSEIVNRLKNQNENRENIEQFSDHETVWEINHSRFLLELRNNLLTSAVKSRVDEAGSELMRIFLDMTNSDWDDQVSKHFYRTDINDEIAAKAENPQLKTFHDQYVKVLEENRTRFIDKVGDEGGGAFQINFSHLLKQISAATMDNVVLEKFGSKALRIFRVVREKKYVEESQIQGLVMIPIKETKLLTYQLLENNFIQLQELKKSLASNAPSKSFYLFYVDENSVRCRTANILC